MIRTILCGRKHIAARCLEFLHGSSKFDLRGVLTDSQFDDSPTVEVARELGVSVLDWGDVNNAAENGQLEVDLIVSMLYWRKFKKPLLEIPRLGTINFHPAPLPEYKGTAGYNLAILESLDEWGVSAHYVDEEIDTGPIIKTQSFPIDLHRETVSSLERKSAEALFELFMNVLERVADKNSILPTSPNEGGRYVSRLEMEAMKQVIPGDDVARKIRAFWYPPYKGAFIELDGKNYTLVSDEVLENLAPAGTTNLFSKKI